LWFDSLWQGLGPAPLVEVDRGMKVGTGRPCHDGDAAVGAVRKACSSRGGRLQHRPAMRFERATEVAAASFDPESDHVEHLPLLDVAEVDRPAGLPAP